MKNLENNVMGKFDLVPPTPGRQMAAFMWCGIQHGELTITL